ncbi:MAG: hypothetical protein AABY40_00550 [Nanoarchaeota archaeon]
MTRRKSFQGRKRNGGRNAYRKARASRQTDNISDRTLMIMMLLVLVVSVLSATMYVYAFYGGSSITPKSQETDSIPVEQQTVSGVATLQIVKPPKGSK